MSRRGENIHKRKDGRWEARYKKGVDSNGATVYGSVYAKTYREAKEKQQKLIREIHAVPKRPSSGMKVKELLELWLEDNRMRLKDSTQYRYRYLIDAHILPALGEEEIQTITASAVNAFLTRKLESGRLDHSGGLSSAYVRSMMLIMKAALNYAGRLQLCPPLAGVIHRPPYAAKPLRILDGEEQTLLLHYCMTNQNETTAGILISMFSGLRIGEVCALRWEDVDLENRVLHIRHTVSRGGKEKGTVIQSPKTRASRRDIPISSKLLPVLEAGYRRRNSDYVTSQDSGFTNPRTYEYRYHSVLRSCGIPDINYHALRHTFATGCVASGMDIKSLSEILGHTSASTTLNIYVHASMERKRKQIEKLFAQ